MPEFEKWSDDELRAELRELDQDPEVSECWFTDWELTFLNDLAYNTLGDLTDKQREVCIRIIRKIWERQGGR